MTRQFVRTPDFPKARKMLSSGYALPIVIKTCHLTEHQAMDLNRRVFLEAAVERERARREMAHRPRFPREFRRTHDGATGR